MLLSVFAFGSFEVWICLLKPKNVQLHQLWWKQSVLSYFKAIYRIFIAGLLHFCKFLPNEATSSWIMIQKTGNSMKIPYYDRKIEVIFLSVANMSWSDMWLKKKINISSPCTVNRGYTVLCIAPFHGNT